MILAYLVFVLAASIVVGYVLIVHSFLRRDTSADTPEHRSAEQGSRASSESSHRGGLTHRHA